MIKDYKALVKETTDRKKYVIFFGSRKKAQKIGTFRERITKSIKVSTKESD